MLKPGNLDDARMNDARDSNPGLFDASLVPPEINVETASTGTAGELADGLELAERFRHSGWQRARTLIYASLRRTMQSVSRITSFDSCGYCAFVYRTVDSPHEYRLGGSSCRDRFCLPCARDRSRCLATNVIKALDGKPSRFVTLTLRQTGASLDEYLKRLYDSFRKLRSTAFWKRKVKGGCGFCEIKRNEAGTDWNVHLHMIVHGSYLPQDKLSKLWYRITKDSFKVDVRFVYDKQQVGRYVVKYVSKPFNNTFVNRSDCLDEVVLATKGKRLCMTFGDWRGIKLTETPNDRDWIALGTFHDIALAASNGDAEALEAMKQICHEDADEIIAYVGRARPPPKTKPIALDQLTFGWPAVDGRF